MSGRLWLIWKFDPTVNKTADLHCEERSFEASQNSPMQLPRPREHPKLILLNMPRIILESYFVLEHYFVRSQRKTAQFCEMKWG